MVWQGSQAAFTASTRNAGSSWSTGNVTLTDDDLGAAASRWRTSFPARPAKNASWSLPTPTSRARSGPTLRTSSPPKALRTGSTSTWSRARAGRSTTAQDSPPRPTPSPNCPSPPWPRSTAISPPAARSWQTDGTPGETQSYRGTWRFDTTGLSQDDINALQGARVGIDLVWELQSDDSPTTP